MKPRRKALLATTLGTALATVGFAATAPEKVLQAEFARQRWLAGAELRTADVADQRWSKPATWPRRTSR